MGFMQRLRGVFVGKVDGSGNYLWNKTLGPAATSNLDCGAITADASGNWLLSGNYANNPDLGGGPLPQATNNTIYVAKLSATGAFLQSTGNGGPDFARIGNLATDVSGNVLLTGVFQTSINFGGPPLTSVGNGDVFLVKLAPTLMYLASKDYGSTGSAVGYSLIASGTNVLLGGQYGGPIDFGNGPLPAPPPLPYQAGFVARVSP
jgi:hypothetical protein